MLSVVPVGVVSKKRIRNTWASRSEAIDRFDEGPVPLLDVNLQRRGNLQACSYVVPEVVMDEPDPLPLCAGLSANYQTPQRNEDASKAARSVRAVQPGARVRQERQGQYRPGG